MNSKILVKDYASLMEHKIMRDESMEMTHLLYQADIIVNPSFSSVLNKTVIINLPIEVPLDKLMQYNSIISRFPIGYGIEVAPYELPEGRKSKESKDYSLLILSKDLLTDLDYAEIVDDNDFLIGVDALIDGSITLVGYVLLKNRLEDLSEGSETVGQG